MFDFKTQKQIVKWFILFLLMFGFLILSIEICESQTRTTNFSAPLYNTGQVLTAGSKTDTSTTNVGLNSVALRFDKYLGLAAMRHLNHTITGRWTFSDYLQFTDTTIFTGGLNQLTGQTKLFSGTNVIPLTVRKNDAGNADIIYVMDFSANPVFYINSTGQTYGTDFFASTFNSTTADVADAGVFRLANNESIAWEASPAGTDVTLTTNSSEVLTSSSPISATTGFQIAGAATTGTILRGNGTNYLASTSTYPDGATQGNIMYASATNTWSGLGNGTSGQILQQGGSVPGWTTATYPSTAGTDNNFLRSNGTNFVSEAINDSLIDKACSWTNISAVTAADSLTFWIPTLNGYTLRSIVAVRTGGTSASINVVRDSAGTRVDLLTANYATTTSVASAGTVQNTTIRENFKIQGVIRAIAGTVTEIFVQCSFVKAIN
ncbi:MAG: hypothetical protein EPO24_09385 [Bacteroidetes bacterium]|nr:MAG: hypothetical protein EPO24_09385 [Bacteroidota bacterium]